ncbi:MAG: hypothetical protein JO199_02990 [Candidatus Eremiobacteraeota bacterium]|nr:hypothetical protein [Candidatus Eremiobacteraeota bacterium]
MPAPPEFDEEGRLYAFRFPKRKPEPVVIDRDRLFDYKRRRRHTADGRSVPVLPDVGVRRFLRDLRNRADFFTGVRDLQTHAEVEPYEPELRFGQNQKTVALAPARRARRGTIQSSGLLSSFTEDDGSGIGL